MLADGELAGTVAYQHRWLALAIALLVVVVAWNAGVLLWGRPRRDRRSQPTERVELDQLRRDCLAAIDRLASDHDAGRVDDRAAHRQLSAIVREFVEAADGEPVTSMTLARLRAQGRPDLAGLVDLVAATYPPTFETAAPSDAFGRTLPRARSLVASWR